MKVDKIKIIDFFNKAKMHKEHGIMEWLIKFEDDGMHIVGASPDKSAMTSSWLKSSAIKDYEKIGNIGMNDLDRVIKVFDRFEDEVKLKREGNLLTISSGNKSVGIELLSEKFFTKETKTPDLVYEETFKMTSGQLKEILEDVKMNNDAVLNITTEKGKVIFDNTGKYKFRTELDAPNCKGDVKVKMGLPFVNAVTNLKKDLEIGVKTEFPIKVVEKTKDSEITVIVAPRIQNED